MTPYRIRSAAEETSCEWCGFPLYVGDSAIELDDRIYCGRSCATEHRQRLELQRDDDASHGRRRPMM